MLLKMGLAGWLVSLVLGFVVGGVFFLTMKLQVEYVLKHRGPEWLTPACMYARVIFIGLVLVVVAVGMKQQREKIPAAMLAGVTGAFVARLLIGRMVRSASGERTEENGDV